MTDLELINKIKDNGDESSLLELANRHTGIFYQTVERNAPFYRVNNIDDFKERKLWFTYKAAKSFDETKGANFCTWLGNTTRFALLKARVEERDEPDFCELDGHEIPLDESPSSQLETKDLLKTIFDFLPERFDERTQKIFKDHLLEGKTFKQIAEEYNVSFQMIQQIFSNTKRVLKKKFKKDYLPCQAE